VGGNKLRRFGCEFCLRLADDLDVADNNGLGLMIAFQRRALSIS
jgi:hypothetical protein